MNHKKLAGSVNLGKYIDKPTLDEVKNYLRVEHSYDDKIILDLIESSYNLTTILESIEKRYYKRSNNKPLKDQSYHQKRIADVLDSIDKKFDLLYSTNPISGTTTIVGGRSLSKDELTKMFKLYSQGLLKDDDGNYIN